MADFCKQCSEEMFGEDFGDLRGLSGPHDTHVICEGCGPTVVDAEGRCIGGACPKHTVHSQGSTKRILREGREEQDAVDAEIKERIRILIEVDVPEFRKRLIVTKFVMGREPDDDLCLNAIHKARYEMPEIDRALREESRKWLTAHGHDRVLGAPWPPEGVMPEELHLPEGTKWN